MKKAILALGTLVLLAACSSVEQDMAEAGIERLGGGDVETLLSDTTRQGTEPNGTQWVVYYDPNGEIRGKSWGSWGESTDTGVWTVAEDGTYCLEFNEWQDGRERCWRVYEEGEDVIFAGISGGANDLEVQRSAFKPGNTEDL